MIKNAFIALLSFVAGLVTTAVYLAQRSLEVPTAVEPGDWFANYLSDWMIAHHSTSMEDATSGFVKGADSGEWIWVTNTPEWDRGWFKKYGVEFPAKWVPFAALEDVEYGEDGQPVELPGL